MPALTSRNPHRNAPEYANRVNLIKKIKIGKDWRFPPVVPEANGRLKDKVRVNGEVEVHSEGSYYIEWWVSGRHFREATTREDAVECARYKSVELRAIRAGLIASPEPPPVAPDKTPIGDAIDDYLKYVKMQRKKRTLAHLSLHPRRSPARFVQEEVCRGRHAAGCHRLYDVLLRTGLGARTVYDKLVTVLRKRPVPGPGTAQPPTTPLTFEYNDVNWTGSRARCLQTGWLPTLCRPAATDG